MQNIILAFRNLSREKLRSALLGGAIAFGILIVTLVNGLAGGLIRNLEANFSQLLGGQIFIQGVYKDPAGGRVAVIADEPLLTAAIEKSGIPLQSVTRSSSFLGTFVFNNNTAVQEVVGIDFAGSDALKRRLTLVEGSFDAMSAPAGLIISQQTAERLKVQVGDTVLVQLRTVTGQMNVGEFRIAAVKRDPGVSASFAAYANRAYVNTLENLPPEACQQVGILLKDRESTDAMAARLYRALSKEVALFPPASPARGGTMVGSMLQQHNENPIGAMVQKLMKEAAEGDLVGARYRVYTINDILTQLQLPQIAGAVNGVAFVILVILALIIVVGVINTFRIILNERTREIGTMRALGMQRGRVRRLFLLEAFFLFLGGALGGLAAAALAMGLLRMARFDPATPAFMMLQGGHLSFVVSPELVALSLAAVGLITILGAWLPARRAARLRPVDALGSVH
ncbi:MAG TPA: ABC transporter permease [Spirochaetia bacterium]|nr:ABC transporter permease [Spirochaetia bacterium]